ncbi:MAG: TlpA family protein disulfide reductase [Actinomycetota bacterium]|nr:TlpA family protein disulfide reductase [Actinomycetota bacterium]
MRRLVWMLACVLALTGCATGKDAVAVGGQFQFIAPGGKDTLFYDPPESRGILTSFSGESLTEPGRQIGIQDFPNKIVVINVWGSWCGPCRVEMPELQALQNEFRGSGVVMLGLNIRDLRPAAIDVSRAAGVSYDSIFDPPGRALFGLGGYPRNVVPSTIVLDRRHRVAAIFLKRIGAAQLGAELRNLVTEPVG